MASRCSKRLFSLDEVVAELDIPGPVVDEEDWSEDEFEGYGGEPDGQQEQGEGDDGQQESEGETGDRLEIGGECELAILTHTWVQLSQRQCHSTRFLQHASDGRHP